MKKSKLWIWIVAAAVIIVLMFSGVGKFLKKQFSMSATVDRVEEVSKITDEEFNVALEGINVPDANLQDFKGKDIFLNFWGTWCPPCRKEFPTIQNLYDAKKDKMGFVLIAMMDKKEDVEKFLKEGNYNVPVYIASSPLPPKFLVQVFPTTFIVADNGQVVKKSEGAEDWDSEENRQFVDLLTK